GGRSDPHRHPRAAHRRRAPRRGAVAAAPGDAREGRRCLAAEPRSQRVPGAARVRADDDQRRARCGARHLGPRRARRSMRWRLAAALAATGASLLGCRSEQSQQCHEIMASAQIKVNEIDSNSALSVQESLKATEEALAACRKAGNDSEAEQLEAARVRLSEHLGRLKERDARAEQANLSPAELERLEKRGDPSCPKGQAYKHKKSGKEIRCTGPQPIGMSLRQAQEYYEKRGYKLEQSAASLRAEYGAELVVFDYASGGGAPPSCVTLYPPPGMSWQEFTARMSGERPDQLERTKSVTRDGETLPVAVEEGPNKQIVRIGACAE